MSTIDDIKVRTYTIANAELLSLQNRRVLIQADLDKCDAEIANKQAEITAMSTGFKAAIDAAAVILEETPIK
jgi:hypothetical protein